MVIGKENNDFFYTSSAITVVVSISDIAQKLYRDSKEEVLLLLKGTQVGYYWLPIRYKDVTYPIFDNYIEFRQWFEDNLYEVPAGVYIGDDAPTLPSPYPFWLDTSTSPEVLFININNEFWLEYAGGTSQIEINDSTASTSTVYSSDKVEDLLSGKEDSLEFTPEDVSNKVTSFQITPDDTHYASEKLVKDSLDNKEDSLGFTPTQKLTASITIAVADWSGGLTCTKEVAGLLATDTVIPVMDRTNFDLYSDAYITADSSVAGEITFTCETTPTAEIVIPLEIIR